LKFILFKKIKTTKIKIKKKRDLFLKKMWKTSREFQIKYIFVVVI
jgi:hypothetical protein